MSDISYSPQELAENLPQVIFEADKVGKLIFLNKNGLELFELKIKNIEAGVNLFDFFVFKERADAKSHMIQFTRAKRVQYSILKKDGSAFPAVIHISPIIKNGNFHGFRGIIIDITAHEDAINEIKDNTNRYWALFDSISSGVIVYQPVKNRADFIINSLNKAAKKIEGVKKNKVIGKRIGSVFPGIKDTILFKALLEVHKKGRPKNLKPFLYNDKKNSGWREYHIYKLPNGEIATAYNDITERKMVEKSLNESEIKFRHFYETTNDAMITCGPEGFTDCNDATLKLFGCKKREDFIGKMPHEFSPKFQPDGQSSIKGSLEFAKEVREKGSVFFEWTHMRFNGEEFETEIYLNRFVENGAVYIHGTVRNITKRKKAEKALIEIEAKYRSLRKKRK